MSKSLTINTNPFTKQTNSLRGVPSGSTTPIDENVKWTPQTLTEEQKAQARENIGAAEAGETGATLYEFHYKRDTSVEPVEYYIDADGYEPKEGDLMTIIWDWPFRTDENDPDAAFKNPATLKNNSTNPSIYIKNAHEMETDYDEIDPAVNTRWTVKLEKVEDVWYAYNISTIVQPDWNTLDSTLPSYIKGKPEISAGNYDLKQCTTIILENTNSDIGMKKLFGNTNLEYMFDNGILAKQTTKASSELQPGEYTIENNAIYYYFQPRENNFNRLDIKEKPSTGFGLRFVYSSGFPNNIVYYKMPEVMTDVAAPFMINIYEGSGTYRLCNETIIFPATWKRTGWWQQTDLRINGIKTWVTLSQTHTASPGGYSNVETAIITAPATANLGNASFSFNSSKLKTIWVDRKYYNDYLNHQSWQTYASFIKPYDYLVFGPNNYVMPVALNTIPLTMTDENNNTISGDFVAQNITIS